MSVKNPNPRTAAVVSALATAATPIAVGSQKITSLLDGAPGSQDACSVDQMEDYADAGDAASIVTAEAYADGVGTSSKKASAYVLVSESITTGTAQPLSITDATMAGHVAGGSVASTGTAGVLAGSFASDAAEQSTGAGQAGLGSAASATQPYTAADFPGIHLDGACGLQKADGSDLVLLNVLTTAALTPADIDAKVYAYLAYRSDKGADLKWRAWFYYRRASDGKETPVTPDISVANAKLIIPEVFTLANLPVGAGLGKVIAGQQAAEVTFGGASDIQPVGTQAAGATGKVADAQHVHAHGNQLGGALHANAVASGAAGFLAGADQTKINQLFTSTLALTADETTAGNTFASFAVPLKITKTTLAQSVRISCTAAGHTDSAGAGFTLGIFVDGTLVAGSARNGSAARNANGPCSCATEAVVVVTAASHDFEIKWLRNQDGFGGNQYIQATSKPNAEGIALVVQGVVV